MGDWKEIVSACIVRKPSRKRRFFCRCREQGSNLQAVHYRQPDPDICSKLSPRTPNHQDSFEFRPMRILSLQGLALLSHRKIGTAQSVNLPLLCLTACLLCCLATHCRNFSTAGFGKGLEASLFGFGCHESDEIRNTSELDALHQFVA